MKTGMKLTAVGMNMEEATIVKWFKQPGDAFSKGDPLYEIETEKVSAEVEAPEDGVMVEILVPEDEDAEVGQEVCIVDLSE